MMSISQNTAHCLVILLLRLCGVYTATEFLVQPQSTAVLLGSDLTLDCVARDTQVMEGDMLYYSWEFQHKNVAISLPKARMFGNHSIFVPRLTDDDLGVYQCVIQNLDQSVTVSRIATVVLAYLDEFLLHPKSQVVSVLSEDSIISLQCVTGKSAPPPLVHWEKDGALFEGGTQEVTTFGSVTHGIIGQKSMRLKLMVYKAAEGVYECVAENELTGGVSRSDHATLDIQVALKIPYITEPLAKHIMATDGGPFTLLCPIQGEPLPNFTWFRNDDPVLSSTNTVLSYYGKLTISRVRRFHAGLYYCSGINDLGSVSTDNINVTVAYLDVNFVTSPRDVTVTAGQLLALPCRPPDSYPPARLLWYRDNAPFVERPEGQFAAYMNTSGALVFVSVQLSDEGAYLCVAENSRSVPTTRNSHPAIVTVQASPLLVEPPVATQVVKGRLLRLHCVMTGKPRPSVTWYRNDQPVVVTDRLSFSDFGQELVLRDIMKHEQGAYHCVGTNRLGATKSAPVTVTVLVLPEITHGVENITAMEGETIQLQCVVYGSPQPNITWYRDGTELNLKSDRLRQTSTGLELSYLTGADSGRYRCQASNVAGSSSSEGTLLVHVRPTLIFFPRDRRVNQSQSIIMFCDAEGVPKPNITWLYNGSTLLPEGASVESQRIAISSVQPVHTGWYTCVATNHLGKSNHTAFLLVQVKPYVSSITGSTVIDRGDSLEVLCHVTGVPQPTVRWLFQHFVLVPTLDHRLTFGKDNSMTIRYVTPVDAGQYSCVANNEVGSHSMDFVVTVRDLPLAPHISSVRPLSMSSVLVTWQPGRDVSNKNLTYFVIQFKQRNALTFDSFKDDIPVTLTSYEVDTLLPAIDYLFRVAMRNDLGRSPYSNVIEACTFENAPSSPRNFRLLFHNGTAVELQWEVPRVRNGDIRTYQVQYRIKFQQEFRHRVNIEIPTLPLQRYVCATLRPFTAYQWRVRAATIQDSMTLWSTYTEVLDVTTSAAAPSDSPTNVHLIIQSSSKILVSWEPMSSDSENGALEGYCVLYRELHSGMPKMEKCVPPGILDAKITGLLPWRYYEVTVIAYNNIGRGVESRPMAARTFAQAPSGQPRDIELQALPMLSIQVRWKRLPPETENCDVSGYVVRYNLFTGSTTHSIYVANEGTLTKVISGLQPWSVYTVQVQAFTTQVAHGFGPLSPEKTVRTLASVPGPVTNLTVEAHSQEVMLSWQQPESTNGIIQQYVVYYSFIGRTTQVAVTTTDVTTNDRAVSRQERSLQEEDFTNVTTTDTHITVAHLQPSSMYSFSVTAETEAGQGPFTNVTMQTGPPISTVVVSSVTTAIAVIHTDQDEINTDVYEPVSSSAHQLSTAELVGLVIGAALLALLIIALVALLFVRCCCHDQQPQAGVFVLKSDDIVSRSSAGAPAAPSTVNTEELQNTHNDARGLGRSHAHHMTTQHNGALQQWPAQSRHSTHRHGPPVSDHYSPGATQGHGVSPESPLRDRHVDPYHALDWLQQLNPQHLLMRERDASRPYQVESESAEAGFTNPAYDEKDEVNNQGTMPSATVCNRMRSGSAAAIAVQQTRNSAIFHDKDNLIANDSIVVYDQRTAL